MRCSHYFSFFSLSSANCKTTRASQISGAKEAVYGFPLVPSLPKNPNLTDLELFSIRHGPITEQMSQAVKPAFPPSCPSSSNNTVVIQTFTSRRQGGAQGGEKAGCYSVRLRVSNAHGKKRRRFNVLTACRQAKEPLSCGCFVDLDN